MEALRKGMEIWENNTCVKFVKRTDQSRYAHIYYGSSGWVERQNMPKMANYWEEFCGSRGEAQGARGARTAGGPKIFGGPP